MNIIDYAEQFIGKPYIWGGTGSVGFDCSGLVIECLQAFDLLPSGDWTADTLSKKLKKDGWKSVKAPAAGDVVFFGSSTKYTHCAIMVSDTRYIEAGGGGSKCATAATSTGMVRLRPLSWRTPSLVLRK